MPARPSQRELLSQCRGNGAEQICDVPVIGGAPGGSTAAALLARKGWRGVLPEKDRHPRFPIGESLRPMKMSLPEGPGALGKVADIGLCPEASRRLQHAEPLTGLRAEVVFTGGTTAQDQNA